MVERAPSESEKKLWLQRVKAEQEKGTSPAGCLEVLSNITENWRKANDQDEPIQQSMSQAAR